MTRSLTVRPANGGPRLELADPLDPFDDGYFVDILVTIYDDGLAASFSVRLGLTSSTLPEFIRSLADDWHGWEGVRQWETLEGELALDARHDGRRAVALGVTLRSRWPADDRPRWSARAVLALEPGEELARLAADVEAFLSP